MAELHNLDEWISQEWNKPQKGSRSNTIFEHPLTGELYYFKLSKESYPSEFWSEIIASKIGQFIGYKVLDYNIGLSGSVLGCLSKSMIDKEKGQTLYHGVDVLNDNLPHFEITSKPIQSFQDLIKICEENSSCTNFIDDFVKLLIFDALVGNTDRHTENWAFIIDMSVDFGKLLQNDKVKHKVGKDLIKRIGTMLKLASSFQFKSLLLDVSINQKFQFSPIYDNGSCLGREIVEEKLNDFMKNESAIYQYIGKGMSEIRWNNERLSLFDILRQVKKVHPNLFKKNITEQLMEMKNDDIEKLVDGIDNNVIGKVEETYLSLDRKSVIKNILKKRHEQIKNIISSD